MSDVTGSGFRARTSKRVPPSPPRITGAADEDIVALRNWFEQFYQIAVIETGLLDPTYQAGSGTIDLDNLPNPGLTTIAQAQATANAIYAALTTGTQQSGQLTISGTDDEATVLLDPKLDTDYRVLITPSNFTGSPLPDAFTVIRVTRASDAFAVLILDAPGAATDVTFDYLVTART